MIGGNQGLLHLLQLRLNETNATMQHTTIKKDKIYRLNLDAFA
jgi:hypothetical protein